MTRPSVVLMAMAAAALSAVPASAQTGFPFQNETLKYSINWPSGLSLGDAILTARKTTSGWGLDAAISASLPGFAIADKFHSDMTPEMCSLELVRTLKHGSRNTAEKTTFDQKKLTAHRVTVVPADGGKSDFEIPTCARDALAFLYYAREEMGQGRVAPAQTVYLGSPYTVRIDYTGAQDIVVAEKKNVTDHVVVSVKGPKADFNFEVFFARDAARTPLAINVPVPMGTFKLELVR